MIYLTEWICVPSGHSTIGFAWDDEADMNIETVVKSGESLFHHGPFIRECGICLSKDLRVEHIPRPGESFEDVTDEYEKRQLKILRENMGVEERRRNASRWN